MSPSSSPSFTLFDVRDQLTTTTLFAGPTFLGSHAAAPAPVPVAAIAGGSSAGVLLAIIAVFGWKWWGRQIQKQQKQQKQELEKRKAVQAAIAYRRSVISGKKPQSPADSLSDPWRSRPPSSKSPSDRKVQFAGIPGTAPTTRQMQTKAPTSISSPRPLKATSIGEGPIFPARSPRSLRAGLLDGNTYKPLRPSPLAVPPSPRTSEPSMHVSLGTHTVAPEQNAPHSMAVRGKLRAFDEKAEGRCAGVSRIPRIKASLTSLSGEARRQSKASQNSGSDQSRQSSAGGSTRRWSWRSLINGPGFSFRQIGVGTGQNRLSADTSSFTDWQEEDPSLPIGYAYSGLHEESRRTDGETGDGNGYIFLDSSQYKRGTARSSDGRENG